MNNNHLDKVEYKILAEWMVFKRKRNAWQTSLDVFEREFGFSRNRSVQFARDIDKNGYGEFIEGRGTKKSRVKWNGGLQNVVDRLTRPE